MRERNEFRYFGALVIVATGTVTAQSESIVLEDFEGYGVMDNTYLDPTTVADSGWTRTDEGVGPDWEVTCCSPGISVPDDTFDGSAKHLRLRRASDTGIDRGQLDTDLEFAPMSQGSISFQLNPSERDYFSTETLAFHASLVDSVTGRSLVRVQYTERFGDNNGQFDVFSFTSSNASATTGPFGIPSGSDNLDRWYKVTMTILSNGFWNVRLEDIGQTSPDPVSETPFGTGEFLNFNVAANTPVTVVDTFRLDLFSGNGPSNDDQPTMIDNIMQDIVVAAPPGLVVDVETNHAMEISFPTESGKVYQPRFSDELSLEGWEILGAELRGDGTVFSMGAAVADVSDRAFRALDSTYAAREVFDDFGDDSIDLLKWGAFTGHTLVDDSISEVNMMMNFEAGGTLYTRNSFDPDTPGGVTASGKFTLLNLSDRLFFYFFGGSLGKQDNQRHGGLRWQIFGNKGSNSSGFILDEVRLKNHSSGTVSWGEEVNTLQDVVPGTTILEFVMFAEGTYSTFELKPATSDTSGASGKLTGSATVEEPLTWNHEERFVMFQNNGANNQFMYMDDLLVRSGVPGFIGDSIGIEGAGKGTEVRFPTEVVKTYQPQYSDDGGANWVDLGSRLRGNGDFVSAIDVRTPGRIYQVLDLRP